MKVTAAKWFDCSLGVWVSSGMDARLDAGEHGELLLIQEGGRVNAYAVREPSPEMTRVLAAMLADPNWQGMGEADGYAEEIVRRLSEVSPAGA